MTADCLTPSAGATPWLRWACAARVRAPGRGSGS